MPDTCHNRRRKHATTEVQHHHTDALSIYRARTKPLPDTQESYDLVMAAIQQAEAEAITPGPCPNWCTLPSGHSYVPLGLPEDGFLRDHVLVISRLVPVEAIEDRGIDGSVSLSPAKVMLRHDSDTDLDAVQAYDLGDDEVMTQTIGLQPPPWATEKSEEDGGIRWSRAVELECEPTFTDEPAGKTGVEAYIYDRIVVEDGQLSIQRDEVGMVVVGELMSFDQAQALADALVAILDAIKMSA